MRVFGFRVSQRGVSFGEPTHEETWEINHWSAICVPYENRWIHSCYGSTCAQNHVCHWPCTRGVRTFRNHHFLSENLCFEIPIFITYRGFNSLMQSLKVAYGSDVQKWRSLRSQNRWIRIKIRSIMTSIHPVRMMDPWHVSLNKINPLCRRVVTHDEADLQGLASTRIITVTNGYWHQNNDMIIVNGSLHSQDNEYKATNWQIWSTGPRDRLTAWDLLTAVESYQLLN